MGTALFKYGTYGQTDSETERLDMIESSFVDKKDRIAQLYKLIHIHIVFYAASLCGRHNRTGAKGTNIKNASIQVIIFDPVV